MKVNKIILTLTVGLHLLLTSCKKDPVSCFNPDKSGDSKGTIFTFSNCSTNSYYYLWDFGDGTTSTDKDVTHSWTDIGVYTVKLITYNKRHKPVSQTSSLILITN